MATKVAQNDLLYGSVYALPHDDPERLRLRKQHEALVAAMSNKPLHAPIGDWKPKKIVDVGCGVNADMVMYFAKRFPEAKVYGIDLAKVSLPDDVRPPNVEFIEGNVADLIKSDPRLGLGTVDLWYSRLLVGGMQSWRDYFTLVCDSLSPGGWMEIHDLDEMVAYHGTERFFGGPNWQNFYETVLKGRLGLDFGGLKGVDKKMAEQGLQHTGYKQYKLPHQKVPGHPEYDLWVEQGAQEASGAPVSVVSKILAGDEHKEEREATIRDIRHFGSGQDEIWLDFYVAWGQKPSA